MGESSWPVTGGSHGDLDLARHLGIYQKDGKECLF
jgi:hypothetical protein